MSATQIVRHVLDDANPAVAFGAGELVDGVLPTLTDQDGDMVAAIYSTGGNAPVYGIGDPVVKHFDDRVQLQLRVEPHNARKAVDKLNEVRRLVANVRADPRDVIPASSAEYTRRGLVDRRPDGVAEIRFIDLVTGPQFLYQDDNGTMVYGLSLGVRWVPTGFGPSMTEEMD